MVTSLPELHEEHEGVCRGCALGKNVQGYFMSSGNSSKGILDLIQPEVCRPMTTTSLGRFLYEVTFINDFSWKTWVYFIRTKGEVFNKFQELKSQV